MRSDCDVVIDDDVVAVRRTLLMLSMPPATTTSASPHLTAWYAMATDLMMGEVIVA